MYPCNCKLMFCPVKRNWQSTVPVVCPTHAIYITFMYPSPCKGLCLHCVRVDHHTRKRVGLSLLLESSHTLPCALQLCIQGRFFVLLCSLLQETSEEQSHRRQLALG